MRIVKVCAMWAVSLLSVSALALDRPADPVVMTGADMGSLLGIPPNELVAFRHADPWQQIPVQVDERAVIDFTDVYNGFPLFGDFLRLDYTDASTFTGPDPNPALDEDDEVVFMAKDAGPQCATPCPAPLHVVGTQGVEVTILDPLGGSPRFVYLFRQDGALDPAAGTQYVAYHFNLLSGDYKTTYHISPGPNPEDTTITTLFYERHFSDRWKSDGLRIFAGDATGVDILDRYKDMFAPGNCGRSEDTFSGGEGAFIVNKNGPVRALRSYVGANSGPRTQRQHVYYEQREDITTFLRVHEIPGMLDFFDYSDGALGMSYANNNMLTPVVIDGIDDAVPAGPLTWELVNGPQGSLALLHSFFTTMPGFNPTSYYLDSDAPSVTQCTGDTHAYGSSGQWIRQTIPNTDTTLAGTDELQAIRTLYFMPPGVTSAQVEALRQAMDHPLNVSARQWTASAQTKLPLRSVALTIVLIATLLWLALWRLPVGGV